MVGQQGRAPPSVVRPVATPDQSLTPLVSACPQELLRDIGDEMSSSSPSQLVWSGSRRLTESGSIHSSIAPSSPRLPSSPRHHLSSSPFTYAEVGQSPLSRASTDNDNKSIFTFKGEPGFVVSPQKQLHPPQSCPAADTKSLVVSQLESQDSTGCQPARCAQASIDSDTTCQPALRAQTSMDSDNTCSGLDLSGQLAGASCAASGRSSVCSEHHEEPEVSARLHFLQAEGDLTTTEMQAPSPDKDQAPASSPSPPTPQQASAGPAASTASDQCLIM